nr:hypothetical protein BaRGS_000919 [Batillaria attramentaria]
MHRRLSMSYLISYIWNASREEESFPLAFSILLYKDVEQVERLLRAVYRPHNVYCLHVDLKASPQVMADVRSLITCLPNVIEAPRRISVKWGKFSVLEPELICMKALWRMRTKWRYFINLTGQEFPLKTNKELGPVHVAASRGFVDFVLHSPSAHDLLAWTRKTSFPDETFFATLNNQYKLGVPGSYMGNMTSRRRIALNRWKVWDKSRHPCGGHFVRHICHFGLPDVQRLVHSRHMVANKFSYDYQPLGYDCIEQWYFDKVRTEHATGTISGVDTRYYRDLEIVKFALRENGTCKPVYIWNASREEESFPLAFSILLYKDVEQVERLLRAVYRPHNVYCLHVDLKASTQLRADVMSLIRCLPNAIEAPVRLRVHWGRFNVLAAELICMEALWHMRTKWRYFINLTGQEFPLKTNKELVRILREYRGANDIVGVVPKWKTSFADETFFATLNNQYKFGVPGSFMGNMTSGNRVALNRWKVWDWGAARCGGRFVRGVCQFGLRDIPLLVRARHMVANKFSYDYQPLGYDCIEQWYFHKVHSEHTTDAATIHAAIRSTLNRALIG